MERIIQLAASLPDGSETRTKLTGTLIKNLWDTLLHPPVSYLGDENQYRTADGSNNVRCIESELCKYDSWTNESWPPELHLSKAWNGRGPLCKKCHATDHWEAIPGPWGSFRQYILEQQNSMDADLS